MKNTTFRPTISIEDANHLRYILSKANTERAYIGLSDEEIVICRKFERNLLKWIGRAEADQYVREQFEHELPDFR